MNELITRESVIGTLQTIYDPEIPLNIWDLGLIYELAQTNSDVQIKMTLTALGCPVGPQISGEIENKLQAIGVENVTVDFVWSPPWTPERLTPDGKEQLQMQGFPV